MKGYRGDPSTRRAIRWGAAASALSIALVLPQLVWAQTTNAGQDAPIQSSNEAAVERAARGEGASTDDIVVTGTLLRGAPPVGSNAISVGEEQIISTGATTANEVLASVPQVANLFNNVPNARLGVAANQIQVVRPNLRNLAPETSSSASTLVLFDGHRISPVGVTQNAIDPDILPPIAIERVEVVTDGGSATYGSDAIGGVINFITRKRFDGVKVTARYGLGDNYSQVDAGIIAGKDWDSGSIFAAYGYQHNDALFGRDRKFIRDVDWLSPNLTPRGRSCSPGNVQIGTNVFALPGLTSTTPNACDPTDNVSQVPRSTRHSALVGLHQELDTWLTADLRAFYGERKATSLSPYEGSTTVTGGSSAANPRQFYYTPVPGQNATANQTVFFTLAPLLGTNPRESVTQFDEWGASAEFKANIDDNWQVRTLLNYSRSNSEYHIGGFNTTLLNAFSRGTTATTAINFYNPSAADLPLIAQLIDTETAGQGREELFNARAIVDGTLFTLPGGGVKLAAGYEFMHDSFSQRIAPVDRPVGAINSVAFTPYSRDINSVFGEVQVPVVGEDNSMDFLYSLTLAASVRYDDYSDFGNTTNPKFGVTLKPLDWLGLRGNYSTSFNAPSPVDQLGVLRNNASFFPFNAFVRPGDTPIATGTIALQGSNPGLMPQTAETYSFGIDIDPPIVPGLHASLSYYNVKFEDIISTPSPNTTIFANFPDNVTSNPAGLTLIQIQDFLNASGAPNAAATLASVTGRCNPTTGICNVYELVDFRQGNYGTLKIEGLDFAANYQTATNFGGVDFGISGNYTLSRESQTGVGAPIVDVLEATNVVLPNGQRLVSNGSPRLLLQTSLGVDIGDFRVQGTWNHTSGYDLVRCDPSTVPVCRPSTTGVPTATGVPQDKVGAFDTINLFFKYAFSSDDNSLLKDLEFTLNVNNVFDTDPPVFRSIGSSTPGYANGFTLGRMVQFGVSKKF